MFNKLEFLPGGWSIKMALLRLIAQWRAITTIIVGVLLTAIIGASMPLYTRAISQVGMEQRLAQQPDEDTNIFIRSGIRVNTAPVADLRAGYDDTVTSTLATSFESYDDWRDETSSWIESVSMATVQDGADILRLSVRLAAYDGLADYAKLQSGAWPQATDATDLEIALIQQVAEATDLQVGDVITLEQRGWDTSIPITATISGIFTVDDPQTAYWMSPSPVRIDATSDSLETNVFTTSADAERVINDFLPDTRAQIGWRILFDHGRLSFTDIAQARAQLNGLEDTLSEALEAATGERVNLVYETNLSSILADYEDEIGILNGPFAMLLLQLGALALFFLIVMGALVRRSERREIGMLKSRGVRNQQILILRGGRDSCDMYHRYPTCADSSASVIALAATSHHRSQRHPTTNYGG